MSLTSRERGNPPPRSKSCVACRRAKRRCDFALPCCLRCEQRGIICDYPMRPGGASGSSSHRQALHATLEEPSRGGWSDVDDDQATMAAAAPPVTPLDTLDYMNLDIGALDPITTTTAASDPCAADLGDFSDVSLLGFSTDASVMDMDLVHQPSALSAPTAREFQDIEDAISRRLRFAIEEIRKTPSMMIAETQTPWCHPLLYRDGMPRSIQGSSTPVPPADVSTNSRVCVNIMRQTRTPPARFTRPRPGSTRPSYSTPSRSAHATYSPPLRRRASSTCWRTRRP